MKNYFCLFAVASILVASVATGMHDADPLATSQCGSDLRQRMSDTKGAKLEDTNVYSFADDSGNALDQKQNVIAVQSWPQHCKMQCTYCIGLGLSSALALLPLMLKCYFSDQCNV